MASKKFSAISTTGTSPAPTDYYVGVQGGTNDVLFTAQQAALPGGINTQAVASYTLELTDWQAIVEMNYATANTLTVPLNSSVAFPISTTITVVQYGAGRTTIAATDGVTLDSFNGGLMVPGQFASVELYKRGTNEWVLLGATVS